MNPKYRFGISPILQAFSRSPIGTRVRKRYAFQAGLAEAIERGDFETLAPGQLMVTLPLELAEEAGITCGVGRLSRTPKQYVIREYRGNVCLFLHRRHALPVAKLHAIVYTREAFNNDPQAIEMGLRADENRTHVICAVLANPAGVPSPPPRGTFRLADCIAGNNNEAELWTRDDIVEKCKASVAYESTFKTVAGS